MQTHKNKRTILADANVISHIVASPNADYDASAQRFQRISREWWNSVQNYTVVISATVHEEISAGLSKYATRRQAFVKDMDILKVTPEIHEFADDLLADGVFRKKSLNDARILATCCAYSVDYLVTWNMRDLVSNKNKEGLTILAAQNCYSVPKLCTPEVFLSKYLKPSSYSIERPHLKEEKLDYIDDFGYNGNIMKDTKKFATVEEIESSFWMKEWRQNRKDILAKYDNDPDKYRDALLAMPEVPGLKYAPLPTLHPGIKAYLQKHRDRRAAEKAATDKAEKEAAEAKTAKPNSINS